MKIAITGHTKGIGNAVYNYFAENNEVHGFSRSNGYNISDKLSREKIANTVKEFDIFVNNAYNNYDSSQLLMLIEMSSRWKDTNKIIINISSRHTNADNRYSFTKKQLNEFCEKNLYNKLYILNISPGLVNTDRVKDVQGSKMETTEIISVIDFALNNRSKFKVHNITFGM
jgi:NADP-dependent 3-hydroxy acid dehydrogenase YdfG